MQTTPGTWHQQVEAVICDMDNTLFDLVGAKREACRCVVDYLGTGDPEALYLRFLNGTHGFEDHRTYATTSKPLVHTSLEHSRSAAASTRT